MGLSENFAKNLHWALLVVTVPYSQPHYPLHKATSQSLLPPTGVVSKQSLNRGLIALLSLIAEQDFLGMLPPEWQWRLLLYNYHTFDYGVNRFLCAPLKEKKEPGYCSQDLSSTWPSGMGMASCSRWAWWQLLDFFLQAHNALLSPSFNFMTLITVLARLQSLMAVLNLHIFCNQKTNEHDHNICFYFHFLDEWIWMAVFKNSAEVNSHWFLWLLPCYYRLRLRWHGVH